MGWFVWPAHDICVGYSVLVTEAFSAPIICLSRILLLAGGLWRLYLIEFYDLGRLTDWVKYIFWSC